MAGDREDIEEPVDGRGGGGQAQVAAIRLDIGHGDEGRLLGEDSAIDFDADRREGSAEQKPARFGVVGKVAPAPRRGLPSSPFHGFLDFVQQAEASMGEEEPAVGKPPYVDAADLPALEELDDPSRLIPEPEGQGEHVPKPVGNRYEWDRKSHRRGGGGADGGVAADAHEVPELGWACLGPFDQAPEIGEGLNARLVATPAERLLETSGGGSRAPVARPRGEDELNDL